jgi:hypothetical protein
VPIAFPILQRSHTRRNEERIDGFREGFRKCLGFAHPVKSLWNIAEAVGSCIMVIV